MKSIASILLLMNILLLLNCTPNTSTPKDVDRDSMATGYHCTEQEKRLEIDKIIKYAKYRNLTLFSVDTSFYGYSRGINRLDTTGNIKDLRTLYWSMKNIDMVQAAPSKARCMLHYMGYRTGIKSSSYYYSYQGKKNGLHKLILLHISAEEEIELSLYHSDATGNIISVILLGLLRTGERPIRAYSRFLNDSTYRIVVIRPSWQDVPRDTHYMYEDSITRVIRIGSQGEWAQLKEDIFLRKKEIKP